MGLRTHRSQKDPGQPLQRPKGSSSQKWIRRGGGSLWHTQGSPHLPATSSRSHESPLPKRQRGGGGGVSQPSPSPPLLLTGYGSRGDGSRLCIPGSLSKESSGFESLGFLQI